MGSVSIILFERNVGCPSSLGYSGNHTLIPDAPHASQSDSKRCWPLLELPEESDDCGCCCVCDEDDVMGFW